MSTAKPAVSARSALEILEQEIGKQVNGMLVRAKVIPDGNERIALAVSATALTNLGTALTRTVNILRVFEAAKANAIPAQAVEGTNGEATTTPA